MIFFGWGYKKIGEFLTDISCPNCQSQLVLVGFQNMFTIFWIPVFPVSRKQYELVCPSCAADYPIEKMDIDPSLLSQFKTPWWAFSLPLIFVALIVLMFGATLLG